MIEAATALMTPNTNELPVYATKRPKQHLCRLTTANL